MGIFEDEAIDEEIASDDDEEGELNLRLSF